jgi:hypothetical protein
MNILSINLSIFFIYYYEKYFTLSNDVKEMMKKKVMACQKIVASFDKVIKFFWISEIILGF